MKLSSRHGILLLQEGIKMYEKQGTPPYGALNSYIGNNCISEIAEIIEDTALLRAEKLDFGNISKEQLACAELRSIRLERTQVIAVDADTVYFRSEIFCKFQLHAIGGVPEEEEGKSFWISCKLTIRLVPSYWTRMCS